ncbi:MAG: hypothetical protein HYS20_01295 [Rhodocyclales bacterium]|nr:hypothetical protein [Rhodocyclales bacterium]
MKIRHSLWALPAISTIIFAISLSIGVVFTTQALTSIERTGSVDYPVLEQTSALIQDLQSIVATFKSAIVEGERKTLALAQQRADGIRGRIAEIAAVPGQEALARRLGQRFDAYHAPAKTATEWMMGMASTNESAALAKAETALAALEADLLEVNKAARAQFATGIGGPRAVRNRHRAQRNQCPSRTQHHPGGCAADHPGAGRSVAPGGAGGVGQAGGRAGTPAGDRQRGGGGRPVDGNRGHARG